MNIAEPFDPLLGFTEIERLVSKIYYRFLHLFLATPRCGIFGGRWPARRSSTRVS
jgi:hypothetical protein